MRGVRLRINFATEGASSYESQNHGQVEIYCAINLTILTQQSIKGSGNLNTHPLVRKQVDFLVDKLIF